LVLVGISEPDLGPLLRRLLLEGGYDATLATDGIAVVSTVMRARPDLAVLDVELARLDGLLALELIRSIVDDLPVVLLSGTAGPALRRVADRWGAVLLRKPFQNAALLEIVARACLERRVGVIAPEGGPEDHRPAAR
jgi:DNA-binding response OmpR family regulator